VVVLSIFSWWLALGCGSGIVSLPPLDTPQTNDVIFIGDSISSIWPQYADFQAHTNWIDKGISGQSSFQVALRFGKDVIALHPRTVHILVGTNDVYPGWQSCDATSEVLILPHDTCSNILYMVHTAQHYGIRVVIGTIPPWGCIEDPHCGESVADETATRYARIVSLNNFLKGLAVEQGVTVVDYHNILQDATGLHYAQGLTADGVHPSMQGYDLMTPAAATAVE
jgi:lysophospholipase L1-like esterase